MKNFCPNCSLQNGPSEIRPNIKKCGKYRRKSDRRRIQIYRCLDCLKYFSSATFDPCYGQKKRQKNRDVFVDYCSSTSLRRTARNQKLARATVSRKLKFLGILAESELIRTNFSKPLAKEVQFDDLETFEHTKCKPLSVTLAVEKHTRRILGFEIAQMAAKGKLSKIAFKKYGPRRDNRKQARIELFRKLSLFVEPTAIFESDQNPYYPEDLKRIFPRSTHITHKGQRGSIVGQGELKKVRFDPLFSLNHTCAMLRDNIKRLSRRTWCTTKRPECLRSSIAIYALFHNLELITKPT